MKKYRKIFYIFFLLLLTAATVYTLFTKQPERQKYSARGIHAKLPKFQVSKVAAITIRWKNIQTDLQLKNGQWIIKEREDRPASSSKISKLLNSFSVLAPVKELINCPQELRQELRLTDRKTDKIPGIRIILRNEAGIEVFNILMGKGHFIHSKEGINQNRNAEGRYVLINDKVYLIPLVFEFCNPYPAGWIEPLRLHELQKASLISVTRLHQKRTQPIWTVFRRSTAHPFNLLYPRKGIADNQQLSALAAKLSKPFTLDYAEKPTILPKQRLLIRCMDGFSYQLELTDGIQNDIASLKIKFDPKNAVKMPGENTEQHTARLKVLQQRYEYENRYSQGLFFKVDKQLSRLLDIIPEKRITGKKSPQSTK